jgi:acyl-CoA synthetase (AMP-forming)/AMP-acid ligase II
MATPTKNLSALLSRAADEFGLRRFAIDSESGAELSFAGLRDAATRVAVALVHRFKVRADASGEIHSFSVSERRSNVAILMPNCLELLPVYFGILRSGRVAVPINARLKAEELKFILGDCHAEAVFVHPATWKYAQEALAALSWRKPVIAVGFEQAPPGTVPLSEILAREPQASELDTASTGALTSPGDVAAIIYTSGTTGRPKGAMLTHGNVLFNVESTIASHGLRGSDNHLLVVPLFHVTGLNTIMPTALLQGGSLVISSSIDPEEQLQTANKFNCTTFFGVPTTFYLLANTLPGGEAGAAPSTTNPAPSLRLICYSGAPMSPLTIQRLRKIFPGVELHNFYGLTETTSVTTVLEDAQAIDRSESVGRPPPNLELCVMNDEDATVPSGEVGELCVKGGSVFLGYFKRQEATAEALRGGWFHTGDTAFIDAQGYVFLRGRKKEMIIVAGENVYPIEVENALCAHPGVQEAAAFGREDAALGEVVHAAVVARPGTTLTKREVKAFLSSRLAAFKLPRTIRIVDKLPRNPSGKVVKRELLQ